jgi:hypothetical protein
MKYLKKFNEAGFNHSLQYVRLNNNKSSNVMKDTLKDLSIELQDDGWRISIEEESSNDDGFYDTDFFSENFSITGFIKSPDINKNDSVKETIINIIGYITSEATLTQLSYNICFFNKLTQGYVPLLYDTKTYTIDSTENFLQKEELIYKFKIGYSVPINSASLSK